MMNRVWKRALSLGLAAFVLFTGIPATTVRAQDNAPIHTSLKASGTEDNMTVTYKLTLDKRTISDGRVAVIYDPQVLTLKSTSEGIAFSEKDLNKSYESGEENGVAYAFVNDSAKSVSGTLLTLQFAVKAGLERQDTSVKTEVFSINNEDTEVLAETVLTDTLAVGREKLVKPTLKSLDQTLIGVNVTWKKDKNADGYVVYRSTSANGNYTKIATVSGTNYWDILVKNNTTYYYKIQSYQGKGANRVYSEDSNVLSIKVKKFNIFGLF